MQNAVVLLYLASGSFVACFLGECMILILILTFFSFYDAKGVNIVVFLLWGIFQRVIVGQELVKDKLRE